MARSLTDHGDNDVGEHHGRKGADEGLKGEGKAAELDLVGNLELGDEVSTATENRARKPDCQ